MIRYWIDTYTGTWGEASGLRFIEVENGAEEAMFEEEMLTSSDLDIIRYGLKFGGGN